MKNKTFTLYDIIVSFMSLFSYIFDVGSDILLIVVLYTQGHQIWASLSLAFVAAATFLMQIFSFCWHVTDRSLTWSVLLTHALFLAPLHRYIDVIKLGLKARRTRSQQDLDAVFRANNDICLLRLFESFTESAPQLVLQLYIILNFQEFNWVIGLCTVLSLISLAWSMTAYTDGLRLAYKDVYNRKWLGMMIHSAWQVALIASRVMAMVVFSTVYQAWVFLAVGIHWCVMTAWVTLQNADFGETPCEKRIFNSVVGFIYIFCFLNLKDSRARWRLLAYHIITVVENSLLILVWFLGKEAGTPVWLEISTVVIVFGGFICGGLFMFMYYCCCHPTGVKPQQDKEHRAYWFKRLQNIQETRREPIFDTPKTSTGRVASWLNASLNLSGDFMDSKSVSSSQSGCNNVPDILKCQVNDGVRMLNNSSNVSNYHAHRNYSPATTSDGDSYITRDSGKASYISATSTRHLIGSESNVSACSNDHRFHSHQHPYVATVSRSIGREDFIENHQHNSSQNSSSGVELDKSRLSSLSNTSHKLFSVTDGLAESILSCSYHSKSHFSHDSFYSSPEYKSGKLSPLNAKQLWEESQSRLSDNVKTQSITIVTHTDLDRLCSHSTVTWNKSDMDHDLHHNKSLHGEYDESHFHSNATYLQNNHTKNDHNYALSSSDSSHLSKASETSLSLSGSSMESNISSRNNSDFTSDSNSCYPNSRSYSNVHGISGHYSSDDTSNTYSDASVPQHRDNGKDLVFSDISQRYNHHLERSSQNYVTSKFGSDSCSHDKSYTDSGSSYVSESPDKSGYNSTTSRQPLNHHTLLNSLSSDESIPYADEDVENQTGSSHDLSALSNNQSGSASAHTQTANGSENILSDWFGDISSLHQSKPDLSRFWVSSASGLVNVSSHQKDVSDTSYEPENISSSSYQQISQSSGNHNDSSISLYQYRNSLGDDEEYKDSYRDELRLKSPRLTSAYAAVQKKKKENIYGMRSSMSASEKSSYSTQSPYSCTSNENSISADVSNKAPSYDISPILSERLTDDSGYHRSKSVSIARGSSDTQESVQLYDSASDQIVPGEESFSKYGDSTGQLFTHSDTKNSPDVLADIPVKPQQTPIKVNNFETSPNKLGRNVDLFKRLQYEERLQKEKRKQKSPRKQEFQLSDLVDSPYKFRSHQDTFLTKLTGSPYKFRSRIENLPQLTESPYKFRSRKSDPLGYLQDNVTNYSAESSSKPTYIDKENKFPQECSHSRKSCPAIVHSKKETMCNTARFIQMNTGAWQFQQETDLDANVDSDKRPYVPSFGNKGLKRRAGQLDIPVTKFCYGYSSDEDSRMNENDVVIPGYIDTADNTPGYATVPRTEDSRLNSRLSVSSSDIQRRALQALENTPGFSPIIVPEELQRVQNSSSVRIVKPVVSTPRLTMQSFSGSYQQLATLEPRNSTVDV